MLGNHPKEGIISMHSTLDADPFKTSRIIRVEPFIDGVFKPEDFDWLLPDLGSSSKRVEIADFCNQRLKETSCLKKN